MRFEINRWIETIGMKKLCLFAHYGLAIITSLTFFVLSIIFTIIPNVIDVTVLQGIWFKILIYVGVVAGYITILTIFDALQTMHKENSNFDFIAFYIGFAMFVTLALIVVCVIFMFTHSLTQLEIDMWKFLIGIFGAMFITESGGGFLYKGFKNGELRKMGTLGQEPPKEEPPHDDPPVEPKPPKP